jgi:hypothetical protein
LKEPPLCEAYHKRAAAQTVELGGPFLFGLSAFVSTALDLGCEEMPSVDGKAPVIDKLDKAASR